MFSEKNIHKLIIISPIIAILLITIFTSYLFISSQFSTFEKESHELETRFFKNKKEALQNELESIYKHLELQESIYMNNANEKVIKRVYLLKNQLTQLKKDLYENKRSSTILQNLINSRASNTNYFFAYDVKNSKIIQPMGKDIKKEFKDDEKYFENYLFSEDGKLIPFSHGRKIVFILYLPHLDWIIGNIEDISSDIKFIKKVSKDYITNLKFEESGYAWIVKNKITINENSSILEFTPKAIESEEEEYINYRDKDIEKISYMRYFEPWNWVIGTTLNLNILNKVIEEENNKLRKRVENYIISVSYGALAIVFIITLLSILVSNKIYLTLEEYREKQKEQKEELLELNSSLEKKVKKAIQEVQQKERTMFHQARLARLGSMLSMIAHQWRQPLTEVSTILTELETATQFNKVDKKLILDCVHDSDRLLSYMSDTIDDFRTYFKPDKEKVEFSVIKACKDSISLLNATFNELNIKLVTDFKVDRNIMGYPREFSQVILNILSNAKDIFLDRQIKEAKVIFKIEEINNNIVVSIEDNAKGIQAENIDVIFEPYFSTKQSNKATGMGLYMSKMIIENNMNGKLEVFNTQNGAKFTITM